MKALNKILQLIAILGAFAAGYFYFANSRLSTSNTSKLTEATSTLQFERSKTITLSKTVAEQKEQLAANQSTRTESKSELTSLKAKLGQLQRENQNFADGQNNNRLTQERLQNENARLTLELAELQATSVPKEQVASYQTKISKLERQLLELSQTQTATAANTPSLNAAIPENPRLQGNVLTVGKGASFVILDIGYRAGVRLNNELVIQHADTTIAKIQVTEVKENLSIARVLPQSLTKTPQSGDTVSSFN